VFGEHLHGLTLDTAAAPELRTRIWASAGALLVRGALARSRSLPANADRTTLFASARWLAAQPDFTSIAAGMLVDLGRLDNLDEIAGLCAGRPVVAVRTPNPSALACAASACRQAGRAWVITDTQAHREGVLVHGFISPVGEREHYDGLFSGKKHVSGQNVQVIADLDGRVADVGEPVNGARHDAAAFFLSGIAERWADHLTPGRTRHDRRRRLPGHRPDHTAQRPATTGS
jgi:hypothetical protein